MKTFACISIGLLILNVAWAQIGQKRSCEKVGELKKTTTLIVLDEKKDSEYNQLIRHTIDTYWRITPIMYIPSSELEQYLGNSAYSMLVRNNAQRIARRGGGRVSVIQNNDLALYLCNQGELTNYLAGDALAMVRLKDVMKTEDYLYELPGLIQSMQSYIQFLQEEKIDENNFEKEIKRYANQNVADLRSMTLMLRKEDVPEKLQDIKKLEKVYGHAVEIATEAQIAEALKNNEGNVAFLHLHPRQREFFIIQAAGGRLIYHALVQDYGELKAKDFAVLAKKIDK